MKKISLIIIAVALLSCNSNDKSSKDADSAKTDSSVIRKPEPAAATPAAASPTWQYKTDTDKMTSKQRYFAEVVSGTKLNFQPPYDGGSTASLVIKNDGKENGVALTIDKGQFLSGEGHPVNARFDSDQPLKFESNEPSDGSTTVLFIDPAAKFVKHLKTAKKLILQVEFFEGGSNDIEFDVSGLKWDH